MVFSIRILDPSESPNSDELLGEIRIGDFLENFLVVPVNCEVGEIPSLWRKELESLLQDAPVVALRTNELFAWVGYRQGNECAFQELLLHPQSGYVSEDGTLVGLPDYCNVTEDGSKVSEWRVTLLDIRSFLNL